MKISIPTPCHEKWEEMTPNERGRFCAHCQKTVIDFTGWTDKMLIGFLSKNKTISCGRFTPAQLEKELISRQPLKRLYPVAAALSIISLFTQAPLAQAQMRQQHSEQTANSTDKKEKHATTTCTIRGSILDSKDNEPIIAAIVQFYKNGYSVAGCQTDMDGNYEMKGLEYGEYVIMAKYPGVKTISKIIKIDSTSLITTINFKMEYEAKLLAI